MAVPKKNIKRPINRLQKDVEAAVTPDPVDTTPDAETAASVELTTELMSTVGPIGICPSVPGWKVAVKTHDGERLMPIMLWVMYADGTVKPAYMQEGRGVVHDGEITSYVDGGNTQYKV